jgi:hypothetical protein
MGRWRMGLKLDWSVLELAFTQNNPEFFAFLDLETGEVLQWSVYSHDKTEIESLEQRTSADPMRYRAITSPSSQERWSWMEEFTQTVEPPLQEQLEDAIHGKGAFRRFKDALLRYPTQREAWFRFEEQRERRALHDWLDSLGVEVEPSPWKTLASSTLSSEK